jgi:hypothetical protein
MTNSCHALAPPSGTSDNRIARAKAIAYNATDTAASFAQMAIGGAAASTVIGAAVGGALAFHGGLSFSQASVRLVGSLCMSWPDYQRLEAQTNVVSGVGVLVLVGEGIWAAATNSPYDFEFAQRMSDTGNSLVDVAGLVSGPNRVGSEAGKLTVAAANGLDYWNRAKGYTTLFQPLMSGPQAERAPTARIQPYSPPTEAQWRAHFRERESAQDRAFRDRGGTPRVNDRGFNREIQQRQMDRQKIPSPGRSGRSYYA